MHESQKKEHQATQTVIASSDVRMDSAVLSYLGVWAEGQGVDRGGEVHERLQRSGCCGRQRSAGPCIDALVPAHAYPCFGTTQ